MEHVIMQHERDRVAAGRTLAAQAKAFIAAKAQHEAKLAELLAGTDYTLSGRAVDQYAQADAAVRLARATEPQLLEALRRSYTRISTIEGNARGRVSAAHDVIDRLLGQYVATQLAGDVAGATIDFRTAAIYKSELAARRLPDRAVEFFHVEAADMQRLVSAMELTAANVDIIDAELQRVAKVEAQFEKKLRKAA